MRLYGGLETLTHYPSLTFCNLKYKEHAALMELQSKHKRVKFMTKRMQPTEGTLLLKKKFHTEWIENSP